MRERVEAIGEQTSLADRKRRAGQRMLIGLQGHAVDDDLRRVVAEIQPAGFVLFARNVVEPAQVADLNRELAELAPEHHPALLTVDQEGGRVQRVREPMVRWPTMREVGRAADYTADVSRAMARELRALGFNLNFAPVADVDSNPDNPIIGDRSFGRSPHTVAKHVVAFLRAHQEQGVIACAKHFPGHGDTATDSHLELPWVDKDIDELEHCEMVPLKAAIAAGVGTVMTSHVMFPVWDEEHPATMSPRITRDILRDRLGFNGVVFSDDMEMKAVAGRWAIREQIFRATQASVDVLLCCNSVDLQLDTFRALVQVQEDEPTFDDLCTTSVKRVDALRERFLLRPPRAPGLAEMVKRWEHQMLATTVRDHGAA